VIEQDNVCSQLRQSRGNGALRQQDFSLRILNQERQTYAWITGIDRNVCSTSLEDGKQTDNDLKRPVERDGDAITWGNSLLA